MFGKTIIYAHRGASGSAPENTMAAFQKAVALGAGGIECDVQMTKDSRLVVCHDEAVDRTTNGKGLIKDKTYKEIKTLDAGSWYANEFVGAGIPLLEELLDLTKRSGILLNIELKNGIVRYEGMEKKVIDMVRSYGLMDRTVFSSFNHYSVYEVKQEYPEALTGALYSVGLYQPWKYLKELNCDCAHPHYMAVNKEIAEGFIKHGFTMNVYTVNDEPTAAALVKHGVEGIITNYPEKMKSIAGA